MRVGWGKAPPLANQSYGLACVARGALTAAASGRTGPGRRRPLGSSHAAAGQARNLHRGSAVVFGKGAWAAAAKRSASKDRQRQVPLHSACRAIRPCTKARKSALH